MNRQLYRYELLPDVPFQEAENSLLLSVLAVECLHGRSQLRLDATFCMNKEKRSCVIDAGTEVGRSIAKIFTGFLSREFGEQAFKVERVASEEPTPPPTPLAEAAS